MATTTKGILTNQAPKSRLGLKGATPKVPIGATKASKLHGTSSINNIPEFLGSPSNLDLNGQAPSKYLDNPPA
jgi:hypothetical protein